MIDVSEGLRIGSVVRVKLLKSVPYSTVYCSWNKNEGILQDTVADVSITFDDVKSSITREKYGTPIQMTNFLTWYRKFWISIAESVHYICEVGVDDVEACYIG